MNIEEIEFDQKLFDAALSTVKEKYEHVTVPEYFLQRLPRSLPLIRFNL